MTSPTVTPEKVRAFLLVRYAEKINGINGRQSGVPDSFDLLLEGIVDSFGVLDMVGTLEKEFGIELDMSGLDAEQITVLGPLTHYVAAQANTRVSNNGLRPPPVR